MNPLEIANYLSKNDIVFLLDELVKNVGNKTDLAEKLKLERKTLYNLPDTKDISVETKNKIVRYYVAHDWNKLYEFLESHLAARYCNVIMDIMQAKWSEISAANLEFQRKNIMYDIIEYIEKFDTLLKEKCPERYAPFMEIVSNYITAPIVPRKRYILKYFPDSSTSSIDLPAASRATVPWDEERNPAMDQDLSILNTNLVSKKQGIHDNSDEIGKLDNGEVDGDERVPRTA
jgi:hypothetical protein